MLPPNYVPSLYNPSDYIGLFNYLTISIGDLRYNKRNGVNYTSALYITGNIYQNGTIIDLSVLSGITPGAASAGKLIAVDSNKDITNINGLSASQLTGTLQTAAQPNITSLGTLSSTLNIGGSTPITCNNSLSSSTCSLSVDSVSGDQTFGSTTANKFHLRTNGNRKITIGSTGLVGINNTAPAKQLDIIGSTALTNALYQISDGTVVYQQWFDETQCCLQTFSNHPLTFATNNASVQMSILTNGNVAVNNTSTATNISASTLYGTLQTAAQPNITSIGTLATVTATAIFGTLQTAAQPNLTSLGTLTSLTRSGTITSSRTTNGQSFTSTNGTSTCVLFHFNNGDAYFGTTTANNLVFQTSNTGRMTISSSGAVSGISSLSATTLTGTLSTTSQPNITTTGDLTLPSSLTITNGTTPLSINNTTSSSTFRLTIQNSGGAQDIGSFTSHSFFLNTNNTRRLQCDTSGNIDILNHNASTVELKLGGTLITSSATELNFLSGATPGTAAASKALVMDSNRSITNIAKIN
ncbi:uncharacterized protein PHALS_13810 [Plasmopara halstedii]|uniref:Uncharacterized protein n=1 Tax=Plasmopara halstedii TaxID=4781 RepID=A0A0N7L691_PLAHL|nr:uncharacterized protein PHALS_13810 [Plasmopara halstedii]CEG43619.1 hypothetical protein PHALS_13810 [Plasmopara halstedii]|eukprot:XP_024579988.1 hypothetical protein PHALS_13810 [Plasmopara halstedii]